MSLISSIQIHVSPMKDEVSAFIPEFSAEIYQRISYFRLEKIIIDCMWCTLDGCVKTVLLCANESIEHSE